VHHARLSNSSTKEEFCIYIGGEREGGGEKKEGARWSISQSSNKKKKTRRKKKNRQEGGSLYDISRQGYWNKGNGSIGGGTHLFLLRKGKS